MSVSRAVREEAGFWEYAWKIPCQSPPEGSLSQHDLKWSSYESQRFAWIPIDRFADFVTGEENDELFPTMLNKTLKKQQNWKEEDFPKLNDYLTRYVVECGYGPKITNKYKDFEEFKKKSRKRLGEKTGCLYCFHALQMRRRPDTVCILMKMSQHVNMAGIECHGENGFDGVKKRRFPTRLSNEMRASVKKLAEGGYSIDQIYKFHIRDRFKFNGAKSVSDSRTLHDRFVLKNDILNIYRELKKPEHILHDIDSISCRMWKEKHPENFFMYQELEPENEVPLVIGIQTVWMLKKMVKFSQNSLLAMDSTFSTNRYAYTLHTVMAFNQHYNGLPVAWIISSRCKTEDIKCWLTPLINRCLQYDPNWHVNAFMLDDSLAEHKAVEEVIGCRIFLCTWHVAKAWRKHLDLKVKCPVVREIMKKELQRMMHKAKTPMELWNLLQVFVRTNSEELEFITYFHRTWLNHEKYIMWARYFRNVRHAQQHTNNAIESYHSFLKFKFLGKDRRINAKRVDWLLFQLHAAQIYYWELQVFKANGFIPNHKQRMENICQWDRALKIPDEACQYDLLCEDVCNVSSQNPETFFISYRVKNIFSVDIECHCKTFSEHRRCCHTMKVLILVKGEERARKFLFVNDLFDSRERFDWSVVDHLDPDHKFEEEELAIVDMVKPKPELVKCRLDINTSLKNVENGKVPEMVGHVVEGDGQSNSNRDVEAENAQLCKHTYERIMELSLGFNSLLPKNNYQILKRALDDYKHLVSLFEFTPMEDKLIGFSRLPDHRSPSTWKKKGWRKHRIGIDLNKDLEGDCSS